MQAFFSWSGFRRVLGVVDHAEDALRLGEPVVAGARLGFGRRIRNGQHTAVGRQPGTGERFAGFAVVGFEQKHDFELLLRVVELAHVPDDFRRDVRFVVERQEDGVDRQLVVGEGGHFIVRDDLLAAPEPGEDRRTAPEDDRGGIPEHQERGDEKQEIVPPELQQQKQQQGVSR